MATWSPTCHSAHRKGLLDVKIASPYSGSLVALGHCTDQMRYQNHPYLSDVPGDRNGGHSGPPIEVQYLGEIAIVSFSLTSFNSTAIDMIRKRGMLSTVGTIPQTAIGDFMLTGASMRLLFHAETDADTRNFWCAIPRQAIEVGEGTKYSEYHLTFECHRPPCGHGKANILEDTNSDAYS